jgi:hypothetical protein
MRMRTPLVKMAAKSCVVLALLYSMSVSNAFVTRKSFSCRPRNLVFGGGVPRSADSVPRVLTLTQHRFVDSLQHKGGSLWISENNDNENDEPFTPGELPAGIVGYALAFVAFWPLLALLRAWNYDHHTVGFDIDSYMALKGMMDTSPINNGLDEIKELPPLSPAEQVVSALFGPPSR